MKIRDIITKQIVSYTSTQNDRIERFEEVLIIKSRALRIQIHLSCDLWSEFFKAAEYLNNRISKKSPNWQTPIKTLIENRSKIAHLQFYDCRAYLLKHQIVRKTKMKSQAMIDHLIDYDFINVYRIWVYSKMRIIRTGDVLFDRYSFYDSCVLDLDHLLFVRVKDVIQMLKMSKTSFDDVFIKQNEDDESKSALLIDSTSARRSDEIVDAVDSRIDAKKDASDQNQQMIILEMISNRDLYIFVQTLIALTIDQSLNASKVDRIQISSKTDQIATSKATQHSSTAIWIPDVEIRSESMNSEIESFISKSKRSRKVKTSADSMSMNTRSRKQTYATTLITIDQLSSYFATFSIDLKRSNLLLVNVSKLHKDDLPIESRYWK